MQGKCKIEFCSGKIHAKRYCARHYWRYVTHGYSMHEEKKVPRKDTDIKFYIRANKILDKNIVR